MLKENSNSSVEKREDNERRLMKARGDYVSPFFLLTVTRLLLLSLLLFIMIMILFSSSLFSLSFCIICLLRFIDDR